MLEASPSTVRPRSARWNQRLIAALVALVLAVTVGLIIGNGQANARIGGTQIGKQQFYVNGCGMPSVKVRAWKRAGNYKTVVLLDGLRARNDYSGWEINTNVQEMVRSGINVVEPIGGMASWYTNWDAPSNFNGQRYRYMWECVIGKTLPAALDKRGFRVGPHKRYALAGLSMGGGAALILAGRYKNNYDHAFSLSGFLFNTAPGMRTVLRVFLLDAGIEAGRGPYNIDSMWGAPWSPRWPANDPFVQVGNLRGIKTRIYAGSSIPNQYNRWGSLNDWWINANGVGLEAMSLATTHAFQANAALWGVPVQADYTWTGTHAWGNWSDALWRAKAQGFFKD